MSCYTHDSLLDPSVLPDSVDVTSGLDTQQLTPKSADKRHPPRRAVPCRAATPTCVHLPNAMRPLYFAFFLLFRLHLRSLSFSVPVADSFFTHTIPLHPLAPLPRHCFPVLGSLYIVGCYKTLRSRVPALFLYSYSSFFFPSLCPTPSAALVTHRPSLSLFVSSALSRRQA